MQTPQRFFVTMDGMTRRSVLAAVAALGGVVVAVALLIGATTARDLPDLGPALDLDGADSAPAQPGGADGGSPSTSTPSASPTEKPSPTATPKPKATPKPQPTKAAPNRTVKPAPAPPAVKVPAPAPNDDDDDDGDDGDDGDDDDGPDDD